MPEWKSSAGILPDALQHHTGGLTSAFTLIQPDRSQGWDRDPVRLIITDSGEVLGEGFKSYKDTL